jgi:tetratricopeptide (TPR) repeat protein
LARDAGQSGVAVHYNIAVCQFKLERFDDARMTFRHIADNYPKMRGLAEYNLGLVERRLGNTRAAQEHFIRAWELSPDDEKIRALAIAMIDDVEPVAQDQKNWCAPATTTTWRCATASGCPSALPRKAPWPICSCQSVALLRALAASCSTPARTR